VRRLTSLLGIAGAALVTMFGVAGCSANGPLSVGNAYVPVPTSPGTTVAYLEIRNNGSANELLSVQTSIGGAVTLRAPVTAGTEVTAMRSVADIPVPANTTVHLAPNGYHLLITDADHLQSGKAITLRLTFAHGGTISVIALVTNPESGGSSYFLN
jgi:periplasmic copper chaperone A